MRLSSAILASIPLSSSADRIPRSAGSWGYTQQGNEWGDSVLACNGDRQSPIDIPKKYSAADFKAFELSNFDEEQTWTLKNNGHAVQMTASELNMKTNGGDLPGEYTLAQFHFHWGSSDHGGSEHTLEGKQFFSEVHLVHFKSEYETIGNSVDKSDGLAVLGFFIEEDASVESGPLDDFFQNLVGDAVKQPKSDSNPEVEVKFSMSDILPATLDNYYRYLGSLTTPTCNEAVVWTNFKEPLKISSKTKEFMTQFAKDDHGADLVKNFRNVQALNGRDVSFYSSMEKIVAPMEPVPEVKNASDEEPVTEEDTPKPLWAWITIGVSSLLILLTGAFVIKKCKDRNSDEYTAGQN